MLPAKEVPFGGVDQEWLPLPFAPLIYKILYYKKLFFSPNAEILLKVPANVIMK